MKNQFGKKLSAFTFVAIWILTCTHTLTASAVSSASKGWDLIHDGDFQGAVKLAESKIVKGKENADWVEVQALALTWLDNNKALAEGSKATQLAPSNAHIADTYALILHKNGQVRRAMDFAAQALALDPKDGRAHAVIGLCHSALGDNKQAGSDFAQAMELSPKDFDVNNLSGNYFLALPLDTHSAKKCFDRLVQCFPKSPYALFLRGDCERTDNDLPHALEDYAAALSINPNFLPAKRSRAILYRYSHRYREALPDYDAIITAGQNQYEGRADCYYHLGEWSKALSDFSSTIRIYGGSDKFNPTIAKGMKRYRQWWMKRAEIYENMGQHANALAQIESVLKADPNYENGLDMKQKIYMGMKQYKDAIKVLDHLINLHPIADWYKVRSSAYEYLGDKIKAASDLKRAQTFTY